MTRSEPDPGTTARNPLSRLSTHAGFLARVTLGGMLPFAAAGLVVCALVSLAGQPEALVEQAVGERLEATALATAAGIDGDAFEALFRPGGDQGDPFARAPERPAFAALSDWLRRVIAAHARFGFTADNLYTFVPDPERPRRRVRWAVMAHEKPFCGELFVPRPEMIAV